MYNLTMNRLHLLIKNLRLHSFRNSYYQRHSTNSTSKLDGKDGDTVPEKTDKLSKKLRAKTPIGKLDELDVAKHPYQEKEPLPEWPNNTNPNTGEIGGPRGPEPTRYGDWERKGRVSDF